MAQDNTTNYQFALPTPGGIQIAEMQKVADSIIAIDALLKASETALSTHKHAFAEITEKPTTLAGYGITDGMTADEIATAIKAAVDALLDGSVEALDTLKELGAALGNDPNFAATVSAALGLRVRVDAPSAFSAAQKAQGRANIDALGIVDKGKANGVASLDSTGKVPSTQLPAMEYLPLGGGRVKGTVKSQVSDSNGAVTLVSGDDVHTGYMEGWLPNGKRGWYFGWAVADSRLVLNTENGIRGLAIGGDLIVNAYATINSGLAAIQDVVVRGRQDSTGNIHTWYRDYDQSTSYAVTYWERSSGDFVIATGGMSHRLQKNGQFWAPTDLVARGVVFAGGGSAQLQQNGNVLGSIWGNYGYGTDAYTAITNRIEARAAAFADDRANRKARKAGSWDQWNFTSHDQRMQNQTGENIYYTAKMTGTYADTVMLQISPDNGTYWTVATTMGGATSSGEYSGGCLPPGWWMRLIRSSGSYNANVILVW